MDRTELVLSFKTDKVFKQTMVSRASIGEFIDKTYSTIRKGDSLILSVQSDCVYISTKAAGHEHDIPLMKVDNFGFNCGDHTEDLIYAIMDIADEMPGYVYKAMAGDVEAMRNTAKWRRKKIKQQLESLDQKKYNRLRRSLKAELEDIEETLKMKKDEDFKDSFAAITISVLRC